MARDYFMQTTTVLPPRGMRVELTEIRPLRPNQAVILPGVAVMGQGVKFEIKERTKYRSRSGFAQSDGIAQFSPFYGRGSNRRSASITGLYPTSMRPSTSSHGAFQLPHNYEHYKPQHPRMITAQQSVSDDECYLKTNSKQAFPDLKTASIEYPSSPRGDSRTSLSNKEPVLKKPLMPILRKSLVSPKSNHQNGVGKPKSMFPWERDSNHSGSPRPFVYHKPSSSSNRHMNMTVPKTKYQNFVVTKDDSPTSRISSPRNGNSGFHISNHALCTTQSRNKATSTEGIVGAYNFLFERHLRVLSNIDKNDVDEDVHDGDQQKYGHESRMTPEDVEDLDESDELSLIGEDLVNRSLAEVTAMLDQQTVTSTSSKDTSREDRIQVGTSGNSDKTPDQRRNAPQRNSARSKRISFLVPSSISNIPRISFSSADDADV